VTARAASVAATLEARLPLRGFALAVGAGAGAGMAWLQGDPDPGA
jgi:hypothetical protein